jgi:hypothetical protein
MSETRLPINGRKSFSCNFNDACHEDTYIEIRPGFELGIERNRNRHNDDLENEN